jgi:hypothetical protein
MESVMWALLNLIYRYARKASLAEMRWSRRHFA